MKCPKCGNETNKEDKFCRECGELLKEETKEEVKKEEPKKEEVKEETKQENVVEEKRIISSMANDTFYCVLSLILYFGGPTLSRFFATLRDYASVFGFFEKIFVLTPLVAFGLAVYAKVKYPKSLFAKVLLIVYICLFALALLSIIVLLVACDIMLKNCKESWTW